jgi:16S rRNA (adenine1518-N6/adenine1519-N6)-dimethyltransferase
MGSLQSLTYINELMSKHNLSFKKSLGQNFLIDKNALERIILEADLNSEDIVLEIGPGIGTLTRALAAKAKKVYAVEIDQRLMPALAETLAGYSNVSVINNDILELDLSFLRNKQLKIVANLPYYITTPIIYHLLEQDLDIEKMVFLVQKEVAQRFIADIGTKHYGTTSVTLQAYADVNLAFVVKPVCFIPQPNVESAVISIVPKSNIDYDVNLLQRVVKKAFLQRRKKIINALSAKGDLEYSKEQWSRILAKSAIVEDKRPDSISVEEYLRIVLNI